ncbi:MAG: hypothetical protein ACRD28_09595 [Acidobacteriaceae bacterium]
MKRCSIFALLGALVLLAAPAAQARRVKADAYFGYSHVGANLYEPYTPGMNGWQAAVQVRPIPFVGIEGDLSRYGANAGAGSQHVTLVMFGPRVTVHAVGFSVFAHALGGVGHLSSNEVSGFPATSSNSTSYALGGGADLPLFMGFKLRVTGDYLGNSNAPSSQYSPSHYRIGVGVAYHF